MNIINIIIDTISYNYKIVFIKIKFIIKLIDIWILALKNNILVYYINNIIIFNSI